MWEASREPDVTVTLDVGKPGGSRPSPRVRLSEAAGMAVFVWGIRMGPLRLVVREVTAAATERRDYLSQATPSPSRSSP